MDSPLGHRCPLRQTVGLALGSPAWQFLYFLPYARSEGSAGIRVGGSDREPVRMRFWPHVFWFALGIVIV